jgi:hypothetical protein
MDRRDSCGVKWLDRADLMHGEYGKVDGKKDWSRVADWPGRKIDS